MWIPRVRLVPGHILSLSFCFLAIRRLVVFCGLCFLGLDVGPQQQYNNGAKHACVKTFGIMSLHKLFLLCFSQCLAVMNSRPPQSRTNQWAFPCIACSLESILSLLLVAFLASSHWLSTWCYPLTRSQVASNWLSLSCPALGLLLLQSWDILWRVLSVPDLLSALQSLQHSIPSTATSKISRVTTNGIACGVLISSILSGNHLSSLSILAPHLC